MLQCMGNTMWVVEKQQQDKSSLEVRLHDGKITQRRHHNKSNGTLRCVTHTHTALPLRQLLRQFHLLHFPQPIGIHITFLHLLLSISSALLHRRSAVLKDRRKSPYGEDSAWCQGTNKTSWFDHSGRACACARLGAPTPLHRAMGAIHSRNRPGP